MKKIKFLQFFMLLSFVLMGLLACSNDEEGKPASETSLIEGIWMYKFRNIGEGVGVSFNVFNHDGTGYYFEFDSEDGYTPGGVEHMHPFIYAYDKDDNTIIMIDDEGQWTCSIRKLTTQQLTWIDPDGYVDTYLKYKGELGDIEREYKVTLKVKK